MSVKSRYKIKQTGSLPIHDHSLIKERLLSGKSYTEIMNEVGCSRNVVNHVKKKFRIGNYGRRNSD